MITTSFSHSQIAKPEECQEFDGTFIIRLATPPDAHRLKFQGLADAKNMPKILPLFAVIFFNM